MGCAHRCTFCYVRHFEQRADRPPRSDDYGRSIRVKTNVRRTCLRRRARSTRLWSSGRRSPSAPRPIRTNRRKGALPAHTRVLRELTACLDAVLDHHARALLVVRDVDRPTGSMRVRVGTSVYVSIPTLDDRCLADDRARDAPRRAVASRRSGASPTQGLDVGVGIAPILPGLSDRPEQLEAVVREARAAGARNIWASVVHLRRGVREHFLDVLAHDWPEEVSRYEALFAARAYLPASTTAPITEPVRRASASAVSARSVPLPRREPTQLALAI